MKKEDVLATLRANFHSVTLCEEVSARAVKTGRKKREKCGKGTWEKKVGMEEMGMAWWHRLQGLTAAGTRVNGRGRCSVGVGGGAGGHCAWIW